MGEERILGFSRLRRAHYTCHSGRESKKSWPKHGDILSQSRCCSAGWQGTGRCDCPVVGTSLPNRGKSPQRAQGEGGLLGRPALIPQGAGTYLDGWLSGALAEG